MTQDNQWHDAVMYRKADGNFLLFENLGEMKAYPALHREQIPGTEEFTVHYQDCKYNWNHGQPIVDMGDYQVRIVDGEYRLGSMIGTMKAR